MAGFLLTLNRGQSIKEAALYASAAASASLQKLGCGFLDETLVHDYIKETKIYRF